MDQSLLKQAIGTAKRGLYIVIAFSAAVNLLMLAVPIYMLQIYDRVLTSRSEDTLILLTVIAGAAILTMAGLEAVRGNVMVRIGTWLDGKLAGAVLTGSIVAPLKTGADPSVQGLRDLSAFRSFLGGPAIFPILDSPWAPLFLAFVFMLHPYMGWVATGGAVVLFALGVLNEIATRRLLTESNSTAIQALQQAESAARNADAIEAMGLMPNLVARWNRVNAESLAYQAQASNRSVIITSFSKSIRLGLQVAMLGTGAWLAIRGEITAGAVIAGTILMSRALAPVEQAISSWRSAVAARNAYRRLEKQFAEMPPRAQSMPLPTPKGVLAAEGVAYAHPGRTEPLFRGVTFQLEAGETLGLIGPSGAGKTTLARLLLGNLAPRVGHVRLDGMDVAQWDPEDLGQHCGYLPQDVELFSGTVKENIARMGDGDPEKVVAAAQLAGCHDMVLHFANGYDTPIGEGGAALSGGERQRVALARALYGDPRLVVLDEPNASLDSVGEAALLNALKNLKYRGVTVVVIGHRPAVLQQADKVLILQDGRVQAFGPRDEVLAKVSGKPVQLAEVGPHA